MAGKKKPVRQVWSIGYEKSGLADFIATLKAAGIVTLIDVRDLPLSRRAGFSKKPLQAALNEAGIGYLHLKQLGTPKEGRVAAHSGNYTAFWKIVDETLALPPAQLALRHAAEVAEAVPAALMCVEADHKVCHRDRVCTMLADEFGFTVTHLDVKPSFEA